jgi:hypothetical protein
MKRMLWLIAVVTMLTGCESGPPRRSLAQVPLLEQDWTVATSSDRAAQLSGEESKAILIARGYIEELVRKRAADAGEASSQPQFIDFQPRPSAQGWDVYVEFVGQWIDDKPTRSPGHSTVVRIDRRWKVIDYQLSSGAPPASQPASSRPAP